MTKQERSWILQDVGNSAYSINDHDSDTPGLFQKCIGNQHV